MTTPKTNETLFERAQKIVPGGVNSPVRAFRSVGGTPRFITRGAGAYVWDVTGKRYIDYVGSWGPLILGHAHPAVVKAVQEAAVNGLSYGMPTEAEIEIAELVCKLVPSMERVRFVSSGTEAATTRSAQFVVISFNSQWLPNSKSRNSPSLLLLRIDGLNSAPEIASSFRAILRLSSCQEYWRSSAQMRVTRSRVSKPVTSGLGPMRSPRQLSHRAERGGTRESPWPGLRGRG